MIVLGLGFSFGLCPVRYIVQDPLPCGNVRVLLGILRFGHQYADHRPASGLVSKRLYHVLAPALCCWWPWASLPVRGMATSRMNPKIGQIVELATGSLDPPLVIPSDELKMIL